METGKPQERRPEDDDADAAGRDAGRPPESGEEALNDARALQQMIEGVPDSTDEFRRIERKPGHGGA